jgi:hypothetical protein
MASLIKTLTLGTALALTVSCASTNEAGNTSMQIQRGMSYHQVVNLVGSYPAQRSFYGRGTALQYCSDSTGFQTNLNYYVTVWMVDDRVEGLTQFSQKVRGGVDNLTFDTCNRGFREVDWGQAPYDVKIALDIR